MTRVDMFVAALITGRVFHVGSSTYDYDIGQVVQTALLLDRLLANKELQAMTPPPGFVAQKESIKQLRCDCGSFDISQAPGGFFKCGNCKKVFRDLAG